LNENPYEDGDFMAGAPSSEAIEMGERLLEIHNRGHARNLDLEDSQALIIDDGWHNLRNDLNGAIGFEFRMNENREATHLGMWDDHDQDAAARPPRNVPTEHDRDQPSLVGEKKRGIASPHVIMLYELNDPGRAKAIASIVVSPNNAGDLEGEFRYAPLDKSVILEKGHEYLLTLSTETGDGDSFHDPASFDGLSPLVSKSVDVLRAVLVRNNHVDNRGAIPGFSDMAEAFYEHRLPVGPTLKLK